MRLQRFFSGASRSFGAGDAGRLVWFDTRKMSIKNHFTNRAVLSWNGSSYYPETCLDAGETTRGRPFSGSLVIWIGLAGTRCR